MRKVELPSGATLTVKPAPFAAARALFKAITAEMKGVPIKADMDVAAVLKDALCIGLASQDIEDALWPCLERCTYRGPKQGDGDMKIDGDTFEPMERRGDYVQVCMEVARENVDPFVKSLFVGFGVGRSILANIRMSKASTTS